MFRRIELMFPVQKPALKKRLIADLDTYLADNMQAWELQPNGEYRIVTPLAGEAVSAQVSLLSSLAESS